MSVNMNMVNFQKAMDDLKTRVGKFRGDRYALVGIHEDAQAVENAPEMTMAELGAFLNFGGDIDHPGGTSYGYATQKAAEDGKVTFLGKGQGFMQLGVTAPHKVTVPARPWLEPGVKSGTLEIIEYVQVEIGKKSPMDNIIEGVGILAAGATQQFMEDLKSPPNAKSTIRKKGSDNPLIDKGHLVASVTSTTTDEIPTEGLV